MKNGFIKVAAVTPKVRVADPVSNKQAIIEKIEEAERQRAVAVVFPELCITGYTCGDLFLMEPLLTQAKEVLLDIAAETNGKNMLVFVGLPFAWKGRLYNVAAVLGNGAVLGLVPKTCIPNYNEFYEGRYFTPGRQEAEEVALTEEIKVPMGSHLLFCADSIPELKIAVEICEDVWIPAPPSISHALAGANLIVNLSASDEITGKDRYRKNLVEGQSARLICGYVYASAGDGESTQDVVYSGHNMIAENGIMIAEAERFCNQSVYGEIDIQRLTGQRRRMSTFTGQTDNYREIPFHLKKEVTELTRFVDPSPFVPGKTEERKKRCEEILSIQSMGLKKRLEHTGCSHAVIGISGGLDSTLALLVTVRAFDLLGLERKGIHAVTMPGFGTTDRTYDNAVNLIRRLGTDFREVDIKEAVRVHFRDIGHEERQHDVTYENGQARERTQILMDIANQENGMVIGTGDMSELALGWATYNGDHMSMYGVNASVPKTLVRHLVRYYADACENAELKKILLDILDTPVSPELLPPEDGKISQKTEDIVGPYELHDFFLYHMLRSGFGPGKIYRLAAYAFEGRYSGEVILKWLKVFVRRFFSQQFKRSCLPDGPKVGTVAVSPRGDLRMPSDASSALWMAEIQELENLLPDIG
ncbi:NAD(+) synthase [Petralouisia muris]|uniref:NAD(+) synthase n=1 Tax=Petralouisia muris TaxID=3032872 RepID=A0AC61S0Q8_9FIRM|nr:NAD(+) synthase [Petralouisia muris]TGY97965.1 NAD(+) synthase [Petralouisia muris]